MSPWTKKTNRHRAAGNPKGPRSAASSKTRSGDGVIFISDRELLKKYPWLLACDNVRADRS